MKSVVGAPAESLIEEIRGPGWRDRASHIPALGSLVRNPWHLGWLVFFIPPLTLADYDLFRVNTVLLFVLVAIGFNLMTGFGGQFVVFSATMVGVGSYTTMILLNHGVSVFIAMPAAGVSTAVIGFLLGLLTTRLTGIYLSLSSVGVATSIGFLLSQWRSLTGGDDGLAFPHDALGDFWPLPVTVIYLIVLAVMFVGLLGAHRLISGQWGRELRAMRVSPVAAQACGININGAKTAIVSVGCCYWGVAGALQALASGFIAPTDFGLDVATLQLAMVVIGGLGTFIGPVYGAIVVGGLKNILSFSLGFQTLIFAVLLYVVTLTMPGGIAEGVNRAGRFARRLYSRVRP